MFNVQSKFVKGWAEHSGIEVNHVFGRLRFFGNSELIEVEFVHLEEIGDWIIRDDDLGKVFAEVLLWYAFDNKNGNFFIQIGLIQEVNQYFLAWLFSSSLNGWNQQVFIDSVAFKQRY